MKFKIAMEGNFASMFGKKAEPEMGEGSVYSISHSDVEVLLDGLKNLSDEDLSKMLESKIKKSRRPDGILTIWRNTLSKTFNVVYKTLIPKYKAMEKFEWHNEADNPVDYDTGTIKKPELERLMHESGKIANAILAKPEFNALIDYSNEKGSRDAGTMSELGYTKQNISEMLKLACLVLDDEGQDAENEFYVTAEDHTDGWNYVANHVFNEFYDNPSKFPDLQACEKVFLATGAAVEKLKEDLSPFVRKFSESIGYPIR